MEELLLELDGVMKRLMTQNLLLLLEVGVMMHLMSHQNRLHLGATTLVKVTLVEEVLLGMRLAKGEILVEAEIKNNGHLKKTKMEG